MTSWFGRTNTPPNCFGKSWDQNAAECAGGPDPAFNDGKGGHVRESCGFFNECGSRMQAGRMQQVAQQVIPVTSLTRAWRPPTPTSLNMPTSPTVQPAVQQFGMQQLQQQFAQMQQQLMQRQMEAMRRGEMPMMPQQMMGMGPPPGYQQMMPVNFEIPQYLTRREHRLPDESVFKMLGREVFRSMLKSAGHTFANFWDSTPFFVPPKE